MNIFAQIRIRVIFLCLLALASCSAGSPTSPGQASSSSEENPVVTSVNLKGIHGSGGIETPLQKPGAAVRFMSSSYDDSTEEGETEEIELTFAEFYDAGNMNVSITADEGLEVTSPDMSFSMQGSDTKSMNIEVSAAEAGRYYLDIFVEAETATGGLEYRVFGEAIQVGTFEDEEDETKVIKEDHDGVSMIITSAVETIIR